MTLGVYIQVPFCQTQCTYCNFHTGVVSRDRYEPYAAAVCREIAESTELSRPAKDGHNLHRRRNAKPPRTHSCSRESWRRFGNSYRVESQEMTLEADPETITPHQGRRLA